MSEQCCNLLMPWAPGFFVIVTESWLWQRPGAASPKDWAHKAKDKDQALKDEDEDWHHWQVLRGPGSVVTVVVAGSW